MTTTASILMSSTVALSSVAMLILPSSANAADVNVHTYGARPVVVAPAPRVYVAPAHRVYVAPARAAVVGPRCVTRSARVWVNGRYIYRTVRQCI
ncbi:MAG: hypothetical protein ACKVP3_05030 [Hyphomicrobiaceae bacterium]